MMSWLLPSTEPLVPSSAIKNAIKCFGSRCSLRRIRKIQGEWEGREERIIQLYVLQMSAKFANEVFLPALMT